MKKQLDFIKALFADFEEDCAEHIKRKKKKIVGALCALETLERQP